jgi:hypothetical protein
METREPLLEAAGGYGATPGGMLSELPKECRDTRGLDES